jgi:hypothetical protein
MSRNLYHNYKEIIGYSIDDSDIAQQLRMSLVRAVDRYDNEQGDIENYVNRTLKYECILVLQEQYRDLPKTKEGILSRVDSEDVDILSTIEDLESSNGIEEFEMLDHYNYELGIIRQALKQRYFIRKEPLYIEHGGLIVDSVMVSNCYKGISEIAIFDVLLTGNYTSDKKIASIFNINYAKVGEVKQMMRAGICLLNKWEVWNFTREVDIVRIAKRFRTRLLHITNNIATIKEIIPGVEAIENYKKLHKKNVNREQLDKIISNYHKERCRKDATV